MLACPQLFHPGNEYYALVANPDPFLEKSAPFCLTHSPHILHFHIPLNPHRPCSPSVWRQGDELPVATDAPSVSVGLRGEESAPRARAATTSPQTGSPRRPCPAEPLLAAQPTLAHRLPPH